MKLFDDFVVGASLGRFEDRIDASFLAEWRSVFNDDLEVNPGGAVMALYMRAYMALLPKRPPGNIHARQKVRVFLPLPSNATIATEIVCRAKELKGERRWITLFGTLRTPTGNVLAEAEMTNLWAK